MKKMMNSKRGFTLTEIVVVIAVIVLLSSVSIVGIAATIQKANSAQEGVQKHNEFELVAWQEVKDIGKGLGGSYEPPTYNPNNEEAISQEWQDQIDEWIEEGYDPSDIIVEKDSEGNITNASIKDGATPKTNNSGSSGGASTSTDTSTGSNGGSTNGTTGNNTNTDNDANSGNNTNSGGNTGFDNGHASSGGNGNNVGFAEASTGYVDYFNNGKPGVMSITETGSNSINVTFTDGWNNNNPSNDTCTVSITKNGDNYTMSVISGNGWVATQVTNYNYQNDYNLSQNDISNLKDKTGLILN